MQARREAIDRVRGFPRRWLSDFGKHVFRGTDSYFERQSLVRGGPVFESNSFPWTTTLASGWQEIREELDRVLLHYASLPSFQELSPAQGRIAADDLWRVFAFYGFGRRSDRACSICPRTAALLDEVPGVFNAFFSILAPGKHIPRHQGVTKGFVRCHLGLVVPERAADCRMDVNGTVVHWREGETVMFDDSRPHEVWNDTNETRVVLLVDVPRPMTLKGRALLALLMRVLEQTYYVKEPLANQRRWEARTRGLFG